MSRDAQSNSMPVFCLHCLRTPSSADQVRLDLAEVDQFGPDAHQVWPTLAKIVPSLGTRGPAVT